MDIIRVLRVIEYQGPRDWVENAVAKSIHGEKRVNGGVIRGATLGVVAEILGEVPVAERPSYQPGAHVPPQCPLCTSWPSGCGGDNTRVGCSASLAAQWQRHGS
jgi:hypothetical protein